MEIWLEGQSRGLDGIDRFIPADGLPGVVVNVDDDSGQDEARSLIGSIDWLVAEMSNWIMIPLENLVAAADGTPTRIAARIDSPDQAQGAAHALQLGVDALLIPDDEAIIEAALIAKSQRLETSTEIPPEPSNEGALSILRITSIENGGVGDRACIDLTTMMEPGEGMLIGSSSSSMILVHAETIDSEFVPTRPFRINAGAVHGYCMLEDGTTRYLSELKAGDIVRIHSKDGYWRPGTIGRLKLEKRPLILSRWVDDNHNEAQAFMQQAETVRFLTRIGETISITELSEGTEVIGWTQSGARHIGVKVGSDIVER